MDRGATPVQAFWKVIVPYLMPAIISGALMPFTLSLDEYIVSVFTTGAQTRRSRSRSSAWRRSAAIRS